MDLRTYLAAMRKSWLLIILTAIVGATAGTLGFLFTPPTYATTIDFYVSTPAEKGSNPQAAGQFAEARVNSYIVLLSSEQMAKRVIDATGLDLTPQQVATKIEATSELNTVIVTANVADGSPQRSLQIAQGVAESFPRLVDELDNQGRDTEIVIIHVVSGPTLNANPISPDPKLYVGLGLAAGLTLGLVIAILREVFDNSVRTVEGAQRIIGAPVIGTILYDPDTKRSPLIVGDEATSLRAEAYRQLRTNLLFINAARSANTVMITSSVPLEGKSTTAANLALTFVEFGERVLLIDADLRRPQLSQLLGLKEDVGLTNVLAGQIDLDEAIQPWGSGGLCLLASGSAPPNPSELLGSARMSELMTKVQHQFDKVVIDTPPVLPVTDAAVASAFAEAVVVVVHHGQTSRTQVANAAATLENVDARVVGSVLNMKRSSRVERRRYGHHGYYFKNSGERSYTLRSRVTAGRLTAPAEASKAGDSRASGESSKDHSAATTGQS
jgi:capsular exopolysaccharide synthesis family protein